MDGSTSDLMSRIPGRILIGLLLVPLCSASEGQKAARDLTEVSLEDLMNIEVTTGGFRATSMQRSLAYHLILATLLFRASTFADAIQGPSGYQVKAAFLYNFVKFVEWPAAISEQQGPVVVCVIGKDPFGDSLVRAVEGKKVNGRPMEVRQIAGPGAAISCQVLFVSSSESGRINEISSAVRVWSVLTVGEGERFTERGGMIAFVMEGQRVRFQINLKMATEAGLKVSSKLLLLAAPANRGKN